MCVCVHACVRVCVHVCVHAMCMLCVHMCIHVCMCVSMYIIKLCVCVCVSVCVCVCVCACVCACVYICMHALYIMYYITHANCLLSARIQVSTEIYVKSMYRMFIFQNHSERLHLLARVWKRNPWQRQRRGAFILGFLVLLSPCLEQHYHQCLPHLYVCRMHLDP